MPTSKVYAHINMNALAPFLLFGRGLSDVGSVILHLDFLSAARGARRTRRAVRHKCGVQAGRRMAPWVSERCGGCFGGGGAEES